MFNIAVCDDAPWCEDYVANITIGWYADQFAKKDISFLVEAQIPPLSEEVYADLSCIHSNGLQNALEGCAGQAEPFVRLSAKPRGNVLLLRIENCCSRELTSVHQGFPTTKSGEGHGLGLASMEASVRRRNGYLKICVKDGVFSVDAVLCDVFLIR